MKKSTIGLIIVIALIIIWSISGYNGLVNEEETVNNTWAKVQSDYQRRSDLNPNLVNVVKGYAEHEKGTLEAVIEARSKATQINIKAEDINEESIKKLQAVQSELSSALNKLMVINERYPELKANEQFKELQVQLESTENRIKESRNQYNDAVKNYNINVRKFPKSILANIFGFSNKPAFEADADAQKALEIKF